MSDDLYHFTLQYVHTENSALLHELNKLLIGWLFLSLTTSTPPCTCLSGVLSVSMTQPLESPGYCWAQLDINNPQVLCISFANTHPKLAICPLPYSQLSCNTTWVGLCYLIPLRLAQQLVINCFFLTYYGISPTRSCRADMSNFSNNTVLELMLPLELFLSFFRLNHWLHYCYKVWPFLNFYVNIYR